MRSPIPYFAPPPAACKYFRGCWVFLRISKQHAANRCIKDLKDYSKTELIPIAGIKRRSVLVTQLVCKNQRMRLSRWLIISSHPYFRKPATVYSLFYSMRSWGDLSCSSSVADMKFSAETASCQRLKNSYWRNLILKSRKHRSYWIYYCGPTV